MLQLLAQIQVDPSSSGFPSLTNINRYIGWVAWGSAMMCVLSIMVGGGFWGWGHFGGHASSSHRGRLGFIGGVIGATVIGMAVGLVKTLSGFS